MKLLREEEDGHLQLLMYTQSQTSLIVNTYPLFLQSWEMQIDFWHTLIIAMDD